MTETNTTTVDEIDMAQDDYPDRILAAMEDNPAAFYPMQLGVFDIEDRFTIVQSILENSSYFLSTDPQDMVNGVTDVLLYDQDTYVSRLEKLLLSMYQDFNLFVQMSALYFITRSRVTNAAQVKTLGLPDELITVCDKTGESALKLFIHAFLRDYEFSGLNIVPSEYSIENILAYFNLMPQHMKDLMETDIENLLASVYDVAQIT